MKSILTMCFLVICLPFFAKAQEMKCKDLQICHQILEANQFNWAGEKLRQEFNRVCHITESKCQMITVRADVGETLAQLKKDFPNAYFYQNQIDQEDYIYKLEKPANKKKSKKK